jgi:hypothetical protein
MNTKEKWQAFEEKWMQVMIHPRTFFTELDKYEAWEEVIIFNALCGLLAGLMKTVLTFGKSYLTILTYPPLLIAVSLVGGAVLFLSFKMCGGEGEFEQSVKITGYTQAVGIFSFGIPIVGPLLFFYQLLLLIVMGEVAHGLDVRRSFYAIVIPIVLCLGLMALIATVTGLSFFGGILSHRGQIF